MDGRNAIDGASQQDAFTDRELVGFAVTTTTPACNSTISTQPVDFIINLTDPVNPATVQASDFTVNGIPANTVAFSNGNTTLTFHFNTSPVSMQGPQTMHIAAGAFNRASDNMPNFEFNCTFCYAITPLMVTTTVPPVGGTFSPPAPGNYNYDVNFNQPVDPASVQDSDLMVSGNSGPSVTGHSLLNGNMTVRFTLHMNFGGTLTATLGARAVTANTCNGNAAFTGNYTVQGCPPSEPLHYSSDRRQPSCQARPTSAITGMIGDHHRVAVLLHACTTRPSPASICRPTAMRSLRLPIRPSPTLPAVDHPQLHDLPVLGRPAHRCKHRVRGFPGWTAASSPR